jgi:hypothetical protein
MPALKMLAKVLASLALLVAYDVAMDKVAPWRSSQS